MGTEIGQNHLSILKWSLNKYWGWKVWILSFQMLCRMSSYDNYTRFYISKQKAFQIDGISFIFWRPSFSSKKHFFVFCRNFGFNLKISSNHYSQLKKHLKVDPETRSYDFLTKTHEKNRMCRNILISDTTLKNGLNSYITSNGKVQWNIWIY